MFMLMAMIMSISGWSQQTVTIGTGTTTQNYVPTYTYYGNSATQTIYLATEVGMGGEISSISYYAVNNSTTRNVVIYMGETTLSTFSSVGDAITDLTQVYSGSVTFTAGGWTTITFETPFVYSGSNNLVVGVRDITNSYDGYGSYPSWQSTSETSRSIYSYRDNTPIEFSGMSSNAGVSNNIPNIQLTISPIEGDFCYAPGAITVSNVTSESATLSWTLNEDESPIILQYTTTDDEDWEEATEMNFSSDLTTELTGLTPNTYYKVRIQSDCGTNQSSWKNAIFHTECVAFDEFPYTQDFEGTVDCWTVEQVSGTAGWGLATYYSHSGDKSVYMPYTPGAVSRLVSPLFDISSLANPYLTFWHYEYDWEGTTDDFEVYYRTEDSEDWIQLGTTTYNNATEDFEYVALPLPEGTIQVSFLGHGNNANNAYIDDITIENISCEAPTDVELSEITGHTVEIAWEGDADVVTYKAEDAEEWEIVNGVTENPYTLEGLDGLTTYTLRVGYTCEDQTISFAPIVTFETEVTCPAPEISLTDATTNSATVTWTGEAESYVLSLKNAITNEYVEGVEELEVTENEYTFEDLEESTSYTLTIEANCGEEDGESEESTLTFSTLQTATELPYATDFSGDEETGDIAWLFNNHTSPNYWMIGATGTNEDEETTYGMFVTNNGTTSGYTHTQTTVSTEKTFTTGDEGQLHIEFDVNAGGESTFDYLKVFITPASWTFPASTSEDTYSISGYSGNAEEGIYVMNFSDYASQSTYQYAATNQYRYNLTNGTVHISQDVYNPNPNGPVKVTFMWRNDNSGGDQPAVTISNFSISAVQCSAPMVTVGNVTSSTATFTVSPEGEYVAYYKLASDPDEEDSWIEATVSGNAIELEELSPATIYDVKVATICGDEYSTFTNVTFVTACAELTAEDLPKTWDFESGNTGGTSSYPMPACWNRITAPSSTYPYVYNTTSYAHSGSKVLYTDAYYGTAYSVLPVLSEDVEINSLQLSFYALTSSTYYDDELQVGVMTDPADASTFTLVGSTGTLTTTNTLYEFSLAEYEGEGKYVAIRNMANDSYTYASLYVDDVTLGPLPECSRPIVSNVVATEDQVAITWTSTGTEFEVYLKEATATEYGEPIIANIAAVEDQDNVWSITIEGLTSSTPYTFYVNALCGEDGLASVENTFRTECVAIVVTNEDPFTENFETLTSSDFGCWTEETVSGSSHWTISTYNGSKVAYRTYSEGSNRLISPVLDLSGVSSPYLTYNWEAHNDDSYNDSIYVYYRTSAEGEWVELAAHGPNESSSISAITQINTVALPEANETYQIAFLGVGNDGYGMAIDNVVIENISCAAPTSVALGNATQESLEISWEGEASFIEYKLASSDEWIQEPVTGSPHTITGLLPASIYNVRISRLCDDETYVYSSEETFATACSIVVVTDDNPWVEDFSSEPMCWTLNAGQTPWNYYSSDYYIGHGYSSDTYEALTPIFDISGLANPMLTFFYHIPTYSNSASDELHVYYRADEEETWTLLSSYTTYTSDFTPANIVLETEATNIQFKFTSIGGGDDADGTYLDDVSLLRTPSCLAPTDLVVNDIAGHSATLAWTSTSETVTVAYKTAADEDFTEVTGVSENPYVLSGLAPETQYTVKVGVTCEDNTTSWSTTKTFTTDIACPAPVVTISNITETSVTISYTGDAEEYELKYKTLSDEDWTTETITENPYTLENLSPSTTYTVELRANCGDEDGMSLAGTTSFTTACVTITDFSYTESFEGNSLGCWLSNPVDAIASNWSASEDYYSSSTAPADGSYCAYLYLNNNNAYHHAQLLSPTFDLSSIGNPTLTFSHIQKAWGSDQDTLGLYYRTSAAGEWTYLTSWSSNINTWQNETITLPEPSAEYQLMFLGAIHFGYGIGIDNITIDGDGETPEPVQPTVVTNAATSVSQTSAVLNGEITSLGNQTITARGFEWKLATATDYTVVSATGTTMTATLTGLTANTTYTYKAFATTALGTVYGSELTFTTLEQGEEPCTPTSSTTDVTVCYGETYEFNGQTYTTAGTYTATLVNAAGCDSTATLVLTVNQPTSSTTDVTVCYGETYEFNGQTYSATGTYTATLTNAAGCDSVATLNLTVRPENAPIEETVTLNNDELPYTWRGEQYTEFGTYTVAGEDENGCPQEYVLTLVHNSGIAEVENEYSIALYPNPTSENATLSVKGLNEEATVIVTDQAGRVISTTKLALGQETLELESSKLASGVYYIRIQTANSVRTEKLIRK